MATTDAVSPTHLQDSHTSLFQEGLTPLYSLAQTSNTKNSSYLSPQGFSSIDELLVLCPDPGNSGTN